MKKIFNVSHIVFIFFVVSWFVVPTVSFAQVIPACNGSTFDTFATGTVNGQGGWRSTGSIDQEVVPNTFAIPAFGCKSLRMSNATTSQLIASQVFSSPSSAEAGELNALNGSGATGTPQNHFEAQFDLASVTQNEQAGMHMSISPDRGDGTRMSAIGIADTVAGYDIFFDDFTGTSTSPTFTETQIATGLSRTAPHTIKFVMDFVEGPSNDVVKIFIDGNLVHTGTSWENFYRFDSGAFGGPTPNNSRTVNSLVFYEQLPATPANLFSGYLLDNLLLSATATSTATTTPPVSTSTPPVITLNGSSTLNIFLNSIFTDPGATAVDSASTSVPVIATGTVNTAILGANTLIYTATDSNNNTASTTRTVNVVATSTTSTSTPPVITLNGSSTINVLINTPFVDPGATAVDSASTTIPVIATGTVNTAILGSNIILYTATDSNNTTATTTRTVNVVSSSTPPIITLNGASILNIIVNAAFVDPGATAVDSTNVVVPVTASSTVNTAVIGAYSILYTAIDSRNNVATAARTINVVATSTITTIPPVITLNGNADIVVFQNLSFIDPGATAVDSANTAIPVTASGTVTTAIAGDYVITYRATDKFGNTATAIRSVHVLAATASVPGGGGGGGGGSSGGGFFIFSPLPGQNVTSGNSAAPASIAQGTVNPPTGQVLGVTTFNFTRNLRFGSTGNDVTELQRVLIGSGDLILTTPTRYFGRLTRAALVKWQARNGIPSTGFFGPISRAFLAR